MIGLLVLAVLWTIVLVTGSWDLSWVSFFPDGERTLSPGDIDTTQHSTALFTTWATVGMTVLASAATRLYISCALRAEALMQAPIELDNEFKRLKADESLFRDEVAARLRESERCSAESQARGEAYLQAFAENAEKPELDAIRAEQLELTAASRRHQQKAAELTEQLAKCTERATALALRMSSPFPRAFLKWFYLPHVRLNYTALLGLTAAGSFVAWFSGVKYISLSGDWEMWMSPELLRFPEYMTTRFVGIVATAWFASHLIGRAVTYFREFDAQRKDQSLLTANQESIAFAAEDQLAFDSYALLREQAVIIARMQTRNERSHNIPPEGSDELMRFTAESKS